MTSCGICYQCLFYLIFRRLERGYPKIFTGKFHDRFLLEFRSFFRPQPIVDSRVVANSGPVWYTEVEIPPIPPMEGERDMTLGQRISLYRKKLNISQEELGARLGVSRQAVSKWETDLSTRI